MSHPYSGMQNRSRRRPSQPNKINTHRHWAGRNKHRSKGRISVHFSNNRKQTVTRHEQNQPTNPNYISSFFRIFSIRERQKPSQAPQTPCRSNLLCTTVLARPWLCCVVIWIKNKQIKSKTPGQITIFFFLNYKPAKAKTNEVLGFNNPLSYWLIYCYKQYEKYLLWVMRLLSYKIYFDMWLGIWNQIWEAIKTLNLQIKAHL